MEEEAPSRRSVAELAGRFKGPADASEHEKEKPVRRRPPRSLQLPKTHGDEQEPPGVTSPLPAKAKRNSALIEKLQASLALSPTTLLPSPKSPGFKLLPPAFPPSSPDSAPVTTVTTSSTATPTTPVATSPLTEEEGPASFEDPPTVGEGSMLSNANIKGRARHSIRRRPPSRRHRKSSSGDEVAVASEEGDVSLSSLSEPGGEVFKQEVETDASTCVERNRDQSEISTETREEEEKKKEEEEKKEEETKEEEGVQEKTHEERQEEEVTEGTTNTENKEEEKMQETSQSSVR